MSPEGVVVVDLDVEGAPKTVERILGFTQEAVEGEDDPPCASLGDGSEEDVGRRCNFYRAEAVPPNWAGGDEFDPEGYYGPPYALLQGRFARDDTDQDWKMEREAAPSVVRGDVCLIGGGPHFFIALAPHPEWGAGHTVFGHVADAASMEVVDALASHPVFEEKWGETAVTPLVTKIPLALAAVTE